METDGRVQRISLAEQSRISSSDQTVSASFRDNSAHVGYSNLRTLGHSQRCMPVFLVDMLTSHTPSLGPWLP